MYLTPFFIWKRFFLGIILLFLFLPLYRIPIALVFAGHLCIFIYGVKNIRLQFFGRVYNSVQTQTNKIALTFDDGPDPHLTDDILRILEKHSITATFFVIGTKAKKYGSLVKKCYEAGHTVACHDLEHSFFSNFRITKFLVSDIRKSQEIIENIIGKKPLLYRPPVGLMNPHTPKALRYLNMKCIGWSSSVRDAGNRRLKKILQINRLAKGGEVILLHDVLPNSEYKKLILEQLDELCVSINCKKLESVTVDKMFSIRAYNR